MLSWKNNKNYTFRVCVCSLSCTAFKVNTPYYTVICGLSGCAIFLHYLKNCTIFGRKLFNIKCVFWFSLQILYERFLILRRIQRDTIINIHRSSCKVPVILVRFRWNLNFLDTCSKNIHNANLIKIRSVGAEVFYADRQTDGQADRRTGGQTGKQTDRHDEANSCFLKFFVYEFLHKYCWCHYEPLSPVSFLSFFRASFQLRGYSLAVGQVREKRSCL